jgi:GNAT superfamily N-acetyltransferase
MAPDVTLRLADVADAPAVAELHLRAAAAGFAHIFPPGAPSPTLAETIEEWTARLGVDRAPGWEAYAAQADGRLVGVLTAGPDPLEPGAGQLSRLYVDPGFWGHGVGRLLFEAALDRLAAQGMAWATLWCIEGNQRAWAWYERMGWQPTGQRKPSCERPCGYTPAGVEDVRYRLALAPRREVSRRQAIPVRLHGEECVGGAASSQEAAATG